MPPRIDELRENAEYLRVNALTFSLTELANRIDLPSLALPFGSADRGPYGLMLTGRRRDDVRLLAIGKRVELSLNQ
jgi:aspartyl-tRNA(Asn)/glutamyl-tRNA(Gln) amidotransferase subunit A